MNSGKTFFKQKVQIHTMGPLKEEKEKTRRNRWSNNSWDLPKINDRQHIVDQGSSENTKYYNKNVYPSISYSHYED